MTMACQALGWLAVALGWLGWRHAQRWVGWLTRRVGRGQTSFGAAFDAAALEAAVADAVGDGTISHGPPSHSDAASYISFVMLHINISSAASE
jgi:hypothetical protein